VLDAEKRARVCGEPATTTRTVYGEKLDACAACAASIDAQGDEPKARRLAPEPQPFDMAAHDAEVRRRWDVEQAKLPPHKRRTLGTGGGG
jgi:hypothetical protein